MRPNRRYGYCFPNPTPSVQLLTNQLGGYCLRHPSEYNVVLYEDAVCLTLSDASTDTCHVANAFVDFGDATGRTAGQIADALEADSVPGISLTRSGLTAAGEQAVLLDNFHSYDVLPKVIVLHDNHVYPLTFVPWEATRVEFTRPQDLYATVIDSFSFLPGE